MWRCGAASRSLYVEARRATCPSARFGLGLARLATVGSKDGEVVVRVHPPRRRQRSVEAPAETTTEERAGTGRGCRGIPLGAQARWRRLRGVRLIGTSEETRAAETEGACWVRRARAEAHVEHAQAEEVEACGVGCGPREVRGDVRIGEDERERRHGATSPRWQGREASGDSLQGVGGEVRPGPVPARAAEGCDEGQGLWALMRCGAST